MCPRDPASSLRPLRSVAGYVVVNVLLQSALPAVAAEVPPVVDRAPVLSAPAAKSSAVAPFEMLIARVIVNTVNMGDVAILRDAGDRALVPISELPRWRLTPAGLPVVTVDGERYVAVVDIPGLEARFDPQTVTLELNVAARVLPGTSINLSPARRRNVLYPTDTSFFLNYGLNASGDEDLRQRSYQFATEIGARSGNWLFYNTTNQEWGEGSANGFTRLMTNLQFDDRPNLRRWTLGDVLTPPVDLADSVAMAGISLTKFYSMDPYLIQYPTAGFRTELALPSTVQVRVDGNLVTQRQVQAGPLDISNIAGVTGGQNVAVIIRDPFGRERILEQRFFYATDAGLAQGLHEYSYNLGFLRRDFGLESNDYGDLAASAFHRYAFTDQMTLGLRGQATRDLYNFGPFGTYQSPLFGIVSAGASVGGREGRTGYAASLGYSYTGGSFFSVNAGTRYLSPDYGQLSDLGTSIRIKRNHYASGSIYWPEFGSATLTYNGLASYDGPDSKLWNLSYNRGFLQGKALLAFNYTHTLQPQAANSWLLSVRYYFDTMTSAVASIGHSREGGTQSLSLQRSLPQGEGIGYELTATRVDGDGPDALLGRAFVQANADKFAAGAEYARASRLEGGSGTSRAFIAGSVGYVGGSFFASRPVQDSFALIRVPNLPDLPVYANGWYVGKTNAAGEVAATNLASYYDNLIAFGAQDLPIDYVFESIEKVISPPTRSGTLVTFNVKKSHAIHGVLLQVIDGKSEPLEFREVRLVRGASEIEGFTARRGEFYIEGVDPGEYQLRLGGSQPCAAQVTVPERVDGMTNVGNVICAPLP